jgi:hypothetical protein
MDVEAPSAPISSPLRSAWRGVIHTLALTARAALDVALPTLCVACHEPVAGEGVCAQCWSQLSFIEPPYCERLGIPFVYDPAPACCRCRRSPIRRATIAPAPRCITTTWHGRWSMP